MKRIIIIATVPFFGFFLASSVFTQEAGKSDSANIGKSLYENNCAICHGVKGKGDGSAAAALSAEPTDLTTPKFWKNDAEKRIRNAVEKGFGSMPPVNLPDNQIKDLIDYMDHSLRNKRRE